MKPIRGFYPSFRLIIALLLGTILLSHLVPPTLAQETSHSTFPFAAEKDSLSLDCKSAILMDATTGAVLYEQNADEALPPASVTKIMTLLLIMEAIDHGNLSLDTPVRVSETAAGMGGSQVYLEAGEEMRCEDLLKSVVISSANDAAVALAEQIAGDIPTFVQRMNEKAQSLGLKNTHFENVTGLDDTVQNHLTSARDIAIMSRALIQHQTILQYSSIWMDSIRNGTFGLTNTNRLVRFYRGATGLKTGSTEKAGFCVSVTAERDSLSLICVIIGAQSRDIRNAQATRLLDWGFANYANYICDSVPLDAIRVTGGQMQACAPQLQPFSITLPKNQIQKVTYEIKLPQTIAAPICEGDELGCVTFRIGEQDIGTAPLVAAQSIPRITYLQLLKSLLCGVVLK